MTPTLGFTGDVMLGRKVDERQGRRPNDAVWGDLLPTLRALDGLFVNLECCVSTRGSRWTRTHRPFHFRATPERALPALSAAGVDWASLANNHLLDFGERALLDTLDHLDSIGVAHSGAGASETAAREPAIVSIGSLAVGLMSFTDNTPEYAAGPDDPGVARIEIDPDDEESRRAVRNALADARAADPDLLVASLHWGPNMTTEPSEERREFARWLVEEGVDLIHGHSAHVFHGVEVVDGGLVCYDTGDFVDDYRVDPDLCNDRSFLFRVGVADDGTVDSLRLLPIEIRDCAVHEASDDAAEWSRRRMRERSAQFGTEFEQDGEELVLAL